MSCENHFECVQSETLVLVEAMPLCRVDPKEALEIAKLLSRESSNHGGLPARCAAVMPCPEALKLIQGVGYVSF